VVTTLATYQPPATAPRGALLAVHDHDLGCTWYAEVRGTDTWGTGYYVAPIANPAARRWVTPDHAAEVPGWRRAEAA
jgi:hypothetical protein